MKHQDRVGKYEACSVTGEHYNTYIPRALPPEPPLVLDTLYPLLDRANGLLGQLEAMGRVLPDQALFLYMYVRKEAVLSSQIEGTESTLSDLIRYENHQKMGVDKEDVIEVSNYVAAMQHGLACLDAGFPLCLRLVKEMHAILLRNGSGSKKSPGDYRRSQNWLGGTRPGNARFVPPPHTELPELLSNLEQFMHDDSLPVLVKIALVHLQFETIHPFLDGNGRLGRLLMTLILCNDGILSQPLLYLSLYFKTHRPVYYEHLQSVRETGDWEAWVLFFLEGVIQTASGAIATMQKIEKLFQCHLDQIHQQSKGGSAVLSVYHYLKKHPVTDAKRVAEKCQITLPTVSRALSYLEGLGIVREVSGKSRNRVYQYQQYLDCFEDIEISQS